MSLPELLSSSTFFVAGLELLVTLTSGFLVAVACLGFSSSSSSLLSESSEDDSTFLETAAGLVGGRTAGLVLASGSLSESEELSLLDSFFLAGVALTGGLTAGVSSSSELESKTKSIS